MQFLKEIKDKPFPKNKKVEFREASRAVLFDNNSLIPILFVSKENYHKLPGGGVEEGENKLKALIREVSEETGCEMEITREVGKIEEYRSEFNLRQISYCYLGKVVKKAEPNFEQSEIDEGFKLVWLTLDEAIKTLKNDKPQNYEGGFIQKRDLTFLKKVKKMVNNEEYESWKETSEILSDKSLTRTIKKGEEELNAGEGLDWEKVKKDLKINI